MRICVFGVGAVGGLIAAKIISTGADVTLYDLPDRVSRLRSAGLTFIDTDDSFTKLSDLQFLDPGEKCPPFDLVFLATKSHDIQRSVSELSGMVGKSTVIVTTQNGIPWWYFQRHSGPHEGRILRSVDPEGIIAGTLDPRQIVGCVVYPAAETLTDGSVRHVEGYRLSLGELDGNASERVSKISHLLDKSGFKPLIIRDIRDEIWLKALGNLSFNPVSALTRKTMKALHDFGPTHDLIYRMMIEAEQVAERLGVKLRVPIERRLAGAGKVGHHKTSMLQDLEAGRRLEINGILGAVIEIAELLKVEVPSLRAVYQLTLGLGHQFEQS